LRILDSKDQGDREILEGAPALQSCFNAASTAFFAEVKAGLATLGVPFLINQKLVRGLDYYSHTAFEFTTTALGAQGAVIAGGRYDGLISTLGGNETPGIGWGAGVERLAMLLAAPPACPRPIAVIPVGVETIEAAFTLANHLRGEGRAVEFAFKGKVGQRLKRASQHQARLAILIGEDELAAGRLVVKDLDTGVQQDIARDQLASFLDDDVGS
jgi:histidyl-tRNA synthetase